MISLFFSSCSESSSTATRIASIPLTATVTVPPTATSKPTIAPTATPRPTPTPKPTATKTATAMPTATPTVQPSPTLKPLTTVVPKLEETSIAPTLTPNPNSDCVDVGSLNPDKKIQNKEMCIRGWVQGTFAGGRGGGWVITLEPPYKRAVLFTAFIRDADLGKFEIDFLRKIFKKEIIIHGIVNYEPPYQGSINTYLTDASQVELV